MNYSGEQNGEASRLMVRRPAQPGPCRTARSEFAKDSPNATLLALSARARVKCHPMEGGIPIPNPPRTRNCSGAVNRRAFACKFTHGPLNSDVRGSVRSTRRTSEGCSSLIVCGAVVSLAGCSCYRMVGMAKI